MSLFWLSFVDEDRPAGEKFLGVAIVEGEDFVDAVGQACDLEINPGGEVAGGEVSEAAFKHEFRNRLLNKEEATALANGGVQ